MVLKLENALHGTTWNVSDGAFRRLRFLLLEDIKLKQWEWETFDYNSFSVLERLVLKFCHRLEKIPSIFADIPTLQSIVLEECCCSVMASAKWIQEEQRGYRNEILEIKILGTVYDESLSTDTDVSVKDDLASLTNTEVSIEDDLASPTYNLRVN